MSLVGRTFSIAWFLIKIAIVGACGAPITAGIIGIIGIIANNTDLKSISLIAGIVGGGISGYFWGKFFGKMEYKKHKKMMNDIGVDVINNK